LELVGEHINGFLRPLREILDIHGFSNVKIHGNGYFRFGRVPGRTLSKISPTHSATIVATAEKL
jgi:hypothetical protein